MKTELKNMFTEYWEYLAVSSACKLNLFDSIHEGQDTLEKLCKVNNWDSKTLSFLLDFLSDKDYLAVSTNNAFELNQKSNLLREKNSAGLYYACLNWSGEHLTAWQNLDYSIKTGKSAFENIYKYSYFDYISNDPSKLDNYHKAMHEYALDDYKELPNLINFSTHHSIMDVGGGYGALIQAIKQKHPETICLLFDLEEVINNVTYREVQHIKGDFFKEIPPLSEAIILSRILHDWDDQKAAIILNNSFKALPPNGTLYIIENCTDTSDSNLSLLSLNMSIMCKSFERSSSEYTDLCEQAGFKFECTSPLNNLQSILIFKK